MSLFSWISYNFRELLQSFRTQPQLPFLLGAILISVSIPKPTLCLGLLCLFVAMALAIALVATPAAIFSYLRSDVVAVVLLATLVCGLLLAQIAPAGFLGFAHPIWPSVDQAVGPLAWYSLSIDPSATIDGLVRAIMLTTVAIATVLTGADRRAARFLFGACALLTAGWCALFFVGVLLSASTSIAVPMSRSDVVVAGLAGAVLAAGEAAHVLHRLVAGRLESLAGGLAALLFSAVSATLCVAAYLICNGSVVALGCGLLFIGLLSLPHQYIARPFEAALALALVVATTIAMILSTPPHGLASQVAGSPEFSALIDSLRPLGFGEGSFPAVAQIYSLPPPISTLSTATILKVELGRYASSILAVAAGLLGIWLAWMSLQRGRDWHIPAAAAAVVVSLAVEALYSDILRFSSLHVLLITIVALGLAQTQSSSALERAMRGKLSQRQLSFRKRLLVAGFSLAVVSFALGVSISASRIYLAMTGPEHAGDITWLTPWRSGVYAAGSGVDDDAGRDGGGLLGQISELLPPSGQQEHDLVRSLKLSPVNGALWLELAKIRRAQGDTEKAKAALLLAFDTAPASASLALDRTLNAVSIIGDGDTLLEFSMRRDIRHLLKSGSSDAVFAQLSRQATPTGRRILLNERATD
jgi:hypothetical protein